MECSDRHSPDAPQLSLQDKLIDFFSSHSNVSAYPCLLTSEQTKSPLGSKPLFNSATSFQWVGSKVSSLPIWVLWVSTKAILSKSRFQFLHILWIVSPHLAQQLLQKQTRCSYQVYHGNVFRQLTNSFWLTFLCWMVTQLNQNILCNKKIWRWCRNYICLTFSSILSQPQIVAQKILSHPQEFPSRSESSSLGPDFHLLLVVLANARAKDGRQSMQRLWTFSQLAK